jgi:hypothetical protein
MAAQDAQLPGARRHRDWIARLAVIAGAIALGLWLQGLVGARLAQIQLLADEDLFRAREELAGVLRLGGALVFGFTCATGIAIACSSHAALRAQRFPPPGIWGWGSARVVTGPQAALLARVMLGLGLVLALLSLAGGGLLWFVAAELLACRAV